MNKPAIIMILSFCLFQPTLAGCWNARDKADLAMSELDGVISFSIRDAVTCAPVRDAVMILGNTTLHSNSLGEIRLPSPDGIMDAILPMTIKSVGYMTYTDKVRVEAGSVHVTRYLLSKPISIGAIRFVLSWSDEPVDLDLHLTGEDFHVSYRDMKNYKNLVTLDTDADDGYGAETITLGRIHSNTTYRLYVHKYSDEMLSDLDGQVKVAVYNNNRLQRIIALPKTDRSTVEILQIKNGSIRYTNKPVGKIE